MGIFTDYISSSKSIDLVRPHEATDRAISRELAAIAALGDPTIGASYAAADSVQTIAEYTTDPTTGATFTLTFRTPEGGSITTAAIAFDAGASTIKTAINVAFTAAAYPGWTNDDISVTAASTNLVGGLITITFDGASVDDKAWPAVSLNKGGLIRANLATTPVTTPTPGVNGMTDEVQRIIQYAANPSGGTFTLTFNITGQPAVTTAPIAYNAGAAVIEAAIDAAFTAATDVATAITWTNSDISVTASSTNLLGGFITLTYDGNSVDETNQGLASINGAGLTNGAFGAATTKTTNGSATREALNILFYLSVISGSVPAAGAAPSIAQGYAKRLGRQPSDDLIRAIARDAQLAEDSELISAAILAAVGISA